MTHHWEEPGRIATEHHYVWETRGNLMLPNCACGLPMPDHVEHAKHVATLATIAANQQAAACLRRNAVNQRDQGDNSGGALSDRLAKHFDWHVEQMTSPTGDDLAEALDSAAEEAAQYIKWAG